MNLGKKISHQLCQAVWCASLLLPVATPASTRSNAANEKLQIILDRAPFGPPPPSAPSDAERAAALAAQTLEEEEDTRPRLSESIRLSAMTRFNGVPAAGLVDLTTGRSFFLVEGQTLGGFRLEEVSFETSSVILTKDTLTEPVYLTFAHGQPTNQIGRANGETLNPVAQQTAATAEPPKVPLEANTASPRSNKPEASHSPDLIAAATIVEPDGSTRISFRELHRLRVQESREKAELEKAERESRVKLERQRTEKKKKEDAEAAKLAEKVEAAAENLHRKQIIQAIKDGYEVELNFELTPTEAKELAEAGFDIVIDEPTVYEQEESTED